MSHLFLLYTASVFLIIWGVAHLIPTTSVVRGFGDISRDNKQIITMEWIIEGATLIFTGLLIGLLTILNPDNKISSLLFILIVVFLIILAIISFFTGFRVKFLPYRLCPFILIAAALLILVGEFL
jgi:hypothetical protein